MIRVHSAVVPEPHEPGESRVEVVGERDGHVRRAKRRHDVEAGGPKLGGLEDNEERVALQLVGGEVVDLRVGPGVERGESARF